LIESLSDQARLSRRVVLFLGRLLIVLVALFPPGPGAAAEDLEYCYMGQGAHEAGHYELAITYYTTCIETGDLNAFNLTTVYFNRANAHSDLNDFDQAIQDYDEAIRLDPFGSDLYLNRGLAYANKANYRQAVLDFDEAIHLYPNFALAYQNRCIAMTLLGRLEEALGDCNESLRLQPDNPRVFDSRALTYWLLGRHDEARQDLEDARALDPSIPSWEDRFREYEKLGE
jgi:tetratricopeptide (TPR) repeat protein